MLFLLEVLFTLLAILRRRPLQFLNQAVQKRFLELHLLIKFIGLVQNHLQHKLFVNILAVAVNMMSLKLLIIQFAQFVELQFNFKEHHNVHLHY